MEVTNTIGRRKTAVARVYVQSGSGVIVVNNKDYKEYFKTGPLQSKVVQPFAACNLAGNYDVKVNVDGGGITGQAEAIRLAISRALVEINAEHRITLKPLGLLTRNPKMV